MTFGELTKSAEKQIPSVYIDGIMSRKHRRVVRAVLSLITLGSFIASVFNEDFILDGLALFFLSIFVLAKSFESFYESSRFTNLRTRLHEHNLNPKGLEYPMALVLAKTKESDLTSGLLESVPGKVLMFRLGISDEVVEKYISSDRPKITDTSVELSSENSTKFEQYAELIYLKDKSLQSFLSSNSISNEEFMATASWISYEFMKEMKAERWWSKDNLHAIRSIGGSLDYGKGYELSKYGVRVDRGVELYDLDIGTGYREREVTQLENILVRSEEANALFIDDDEGVVRDIVLRLLKKMRVGRAFFAIENKSIVELDWKALVADKRTKQELEEEILKLLNSAHSVGNIIIYIPNLPSFIASVKPFGVNLTSLFEGFLKSRGLQVIAHSTKIDFHYFIETNSSLLQLFERVIPDTAGTESTLSVVVERARRMEKEGIFFSYPSLISITELADRYITYGKMPSKAIDLLVEVSSWAREKNINVLNKADVVTFVGNKTGVSIGMPDKEEADKLASLESILHERIVGQDEAVSGVASALRRVRSGITNPKRPFASFLFLGPTGVGKTETSKALAESFFGGEEKIIRFDMSEYKEADALPTLLGSSSEMHTGLLASKIRDNPYGVLLLDEFEKASPDVRDLFLQVLDEGEFSDALGNKVNCKNLIIIATSNAGADMIWKMVEDKKDLNKNKDVIINNLIETRVLKPELINRFDGVVVFHPLEGAELNQVAKLMFKELADRLKKDKQIEISIDPVLLDSFVKADDNKEFGARSMRRLIQEKVEDVIARKILAGEIKAGDSIEIKGKDMVV